MAQEQCRENAVPGQRGETGLPLCVCYDGGQRGSGKAFWKTQCLTWALKGDGIPGSRCLLSLGRLCEVQSMHIKQLGSLAEAESAQKGKAGVT